MTFEQPLADFRSANLYRGDDFSGPEFRNWYNRTIALARRTPGLVVLRAPGKRRDASDILGRFANSTDQWIRLSLNTVVITTAAHAQTAVECGMVPA